MKRLGILFLLLTVLLFCISCSEDKTADSDDGAVDELLSSHVLAPGILDEDVGVAINPSRGYYDIVIVDIDRWELCMNHNRIRRYVTSYHGHLWYQAGRFIFEGTLAAMYNPVWDMVTVVALDSGWDRGHICYNMEFVDETGTDLTGTFVYYEFPRRCNWVDAWLDQGQIGDHDAGPYPGMMAGNGHDNPSEHMEEALQRSAQSKTTHKTE